jgi:hypothetical protein
MAILGSEVSAFLARIAKQPSSGRSCGASENEGYSRISSTFMNRMHKLSESRRKGRKDRALIGRENDDPISFIISNVLSAAGSI